MNSKEPYQSEPPEIARQVTTALVDEPGLKLALLYGSAAVGKMRADSDIDIALLFDRPLTAEQKMMQKSRLEMTLKRDVDIVDLFNLNGTILKQILVKGRVLVQADPEVMAAMVRRMIYNQSDMMPYVSRTLKERQQRFIYG